MLKEVETSILAKVRSLAVGSKSFIKDFPDKPSNLETVVPNGQVLIGYKRATYNLTSAIKPIVMDMLCEFEVSLQLKNLRTHNGIYELIDVIRFGLLGFVPVQGIGKGMYPISESFVSFDQGIWFYAQTFIVPLVIIEGQNPFTPIEPVDPIDITQINVGLWRSYIDKVGDPDNSNFDRLIELEV